MVYNEGEVIRSNLGTYYIVRRVKPDKYGCICPKCSLYGRCSPRTLNRLFSVPGCVALIGQHSESRPLVLFHISKNGNGGGI